MISENFEKFLAGSWAIGRNFSIAIIGVVCYAGAFYIPAMARLCHPVICLCFIVLYIPLCSVFVHVVICPRAAWSPRPFGVLAGGIGRHVL